ncbi:MAG: 3-keto-5-aminohexanoate cleavage protein [Solirubrobacteraceae bacterium]
MALIAALNGLRTRQEHAAIPLSAAELAADAVAVRRAGAAAVYIVPRDAQGVPTLRERACDAAVAAVRSSAPGLPVGVSVTAAIDPDPFARAAALRAWRQPPDFIAVSLSELGWAGVARAANHAGIAFEAVLSTPEHADELTASPFAHQALRVVVGAPGGAEAARAVAERIPDSVTQLWHGHDATAWEVLEAGLQAGADARAGLGDVLVLPTGELAAGNAELIAAALALVPP